MTTTTGQQLATLDQTQGLLEGLAPDQLQVLRQQTAKDCTDIEIAYALMVAKEAGISLFAGQQMYCIKYGGRDPKMVIVIGVNGYRAIASRSPNYAGTGVPVWGPMVADRDVAKGQRPEYCEITVMRRYGPQPAQKDPITYRATWDRHAARDFGKLRQRWQDDPAGMLAKCAEVGALRQGFSGVCDWTAVAGLDESELRFSASVEDAPAMNLPNPADFGLVGGLGGSTPQSPAPSPPSPTLDEDLMALLSVCPQHDIPWLDGKWGMNHATSEKREAAAGKNKGKQITVYCRATGVLGKLVVEEANRLGISVAQAAVIVGDHFGRKITDLSEMELVGAMQILRGFTPADAESSGSAPSNEEAKQEPLPSVDGAIDDAAALAMLAELEEEGHLNGST